MLQKTKDYQKSLLIASGAALSLSLLGAIFLYNKQKKLKSKIIRPLTLIDENVYLNFILIRVKSFIYS